MRHSLLALSLIAVLAGCQPSTTPAATDNPAATTTVDAQGEADQAFAALADRALATWFEQSPISATRTGEHRHDARIDDLSAEGRQRAVDANRALLAELDGIDGSQLSRENQVDALLLRNRLEATIWNVETLQSWAWDPLLYNGLAGGAIYNLMAREFAPLPERLASATARMEALPTLFAQMRENLDPARVPKVHADTVARQNRGLLSLVDQFITPHAGSLDGDARSRLDAAVAGLRAAVEEHQAWIDGTLVPNAAGDFRIGAELFDQKLRYSLNASLSREEIRQRAEADIARVRSEMYTIARNVLEDRDGAPALPATPDDAQQQAAIEAALELAYAERPARDQVFDFARQTLDVATAFTREHDLVTVPDAPVRIIEMPEFQRGVAVAYCDSPGPLDKGLETYYAISPIPDEWSDAQATSFLREYNDRMIHLLSIHEGVPGHYLEGAHSVDHPSTLRAVLRSGPFAEGWAVYTEEVMAQAGYLDHDPLFRLVQLKFYLRSVANAILDIGVHVEGWEREQAMELMVRTTFQQESEAAGKWVRAQVSSAQLPTYFVGAQEHFDMRRAVEEKRGDAFDLKAYHDEVLSKGAPPVRFVRQLILDEPIG
ncbi:DUF885 domain-containing protein [Luteimonas sp. MHLX1A]|uniref:DUF885 domain-containing protein n=1 Tax=Alterluteimonas muca TaxID=2878684 RepID=UPI001E415621|nr:DUF885 domain-containing protein [Luteimonas sp. MHLX1A]MCD9046411.1 DUF885 domain-containing protein [Luteimonas sp. MHLX1A]